MPITGREISQEIQALSQKVHFVCGKGGVGKSTVAELLAQNWVGQDERVALVRVNSGGLGMDSRLRGKDRFVSLNLTPSTALKAYMDRKLATRLAHKMLMQNKAVQSFINFVPGLDELMMMGQLIHIAQHGDKSGKFDRVVVDCPATGHGIRFLNVARVAQEGAKMGPIANEAGAMAEFLRNPDNCILHTVALPEELPVSEAMELMEAIQDTGAVNLGPVWVNSVMANNQWPVTNENPGKISIDSIMAFRQQIEESQEREIERLDDYLNSSNAQSRPPLPVAFHAPTLSHGGRGAILKLPRLFTKGQSPIGGLLEYIA